MANALLLIDLQNDFFEQGTLAIPEAGQILDVVNQSIHLFQRNNLPIIASQDWHPANHRSFAVNSAGKVGEMGLLNGLPQIWWPVHCVQNTTGAALHAQLDQHAIAHIVYKGQNIHLDSYSAFFDNDKQTATGLHNWLIEHGIKQLWIMGLATDYCVKHSVLDALKLGYQVQLITDGCKGVNLHPEDSQQACNEMVQHGAQLLTLAQAVAALQQPAACNEY